MGNITHAKVSGIPDGDDESLIRPSDWNADHEVTAPTEDHHVATKLYVDKITDVLDYGLSFKGEVTAVIDTTHFDVASLIGMGTGFFKPLAGSPYEIHIVQADGAAPEGEQTPVIAFTSITGRFQHTAFSVSLAAGDVVLFQHPAIASLGTKATAAATGAVTTTDYSIAYIKQLVTLLLNATYGLAKLRTEIDANETKIDTAQGNITTILSRITAAVALASVLGAKDDSAATGAPDSGDTSISLLKQLVNGLGLDGSAGYIYNFSKTTVPGYLEGTHMVRRILFVIPEALASITVHNAAIRTELSNMGMVFTITQGDALTYPDYESISLTVLGSPLSGSAWSTSNLAHIKAIFGLPILCVDGIAAAYLAMGTDGGNASSKTVLNAVSNIEASILGMGQDNHVGLAIGANTVAASGVTFATLNMSDSDVTEIWYAYETNNNNTDVLIGEIRQSMPDGTVGRDSDGNEVPGTLAFYGCAYSMNGLNTLGQAVFHLYVEKLLHSSTAGLAVLLSGNVGNLVNVIGNKRTATATDAVDNNTKMMGYVKQVVTELQVVDGLVGAIKAKTDNLPAALVG